MYVYYNMWCKSTQKYHIMVVCSVKECQKGRKRFPISSDL